MSPVASARAWRTASLRVAEEVDAELAHFRERLGEVARHIEPALETGILSEDITVRELSNLGDSALEAPCLKILSKRDEVDIVGIGSLFSVGASVAMSWWVKTPAQPTRKRHILNPASDSFYAYTGAKWFADPMRSGEAVVAGPYIDSWGRDDLTFTVSIPILAHNRPMGVVALDLDVTSFTERLIGRLLRVPGVNVILNDENRVVASTSPYLVTGLPLCGRNSSFARLEVVQGRSLAIAGSDWSLANLHSIGSTTSADRIVGDGTAGRVSTNSMQEG
jgi:hypothetical protein